MKTRLVFLALLAAASSLLVPSAARGFDQVLNEDGMQEIRTENGIVMSWKIDGGSMIVSLSARTGGWIAVGFEPSRAMKDANFIIAYVKGAEVFIRDDFGTDRGNHAADTGLGGTSDAVALEGSEKNGITAVTFSIPLDSGDRYDRRLTPGNTYKILLAYGKTDSFTAVHEIEAEAKGEIRL